MSTTLTPGRRINSAAMRGRAYGAYLKKLLPLLWLMALPGLAQAQFEYAVESGTVTITRYNGEESYVVIPDMINGQLVTRIGEEAFSSCESLAHIVIPNSVTSIGRKAFHHCPELISIWISRNVTMIGESAFEECASLTSMSVEDSNPVYKSVGRVLLNRNLTILIQCPGGLAGSYTVPETVTTIGAAAFADCRKLTEVYFEGDAPALGDGVFDGTTVWIFYQEGAQGWESTFGSMSTAPWIKGLDRFDYIIDDGKATIIRYTGSSGGDVIIPSSINGVPVTGIGEYAFEWRADLTSIAIPNSVASIAQSAFLGCSGLTTIAISENVSSIESDAFAQCWGLTAITVDARNPAYCSLEGVLFNKDQTTLIQCPSAGKSGSYSIPNSVNIISEGAFSGCTTLNNVPIPNSVTSLGWGAFEYCSSLTNVTLPDSVTSIGAAAFYECTNLISVLIGNGVTSIGPLAFYNCSSLTSIVIPDSVTSLASDGFIGCSSLTNVILGNGLTSIEEHMFQICTSLIVITIPNSIASIGQGVFHGCSSLTNITIPSGVSVIEESAFSWCTGLTSVLIPSSVRFIGSGAFSSCTHLTEITVDPLNPDYESVDGVLFDKDHTALIQCPGGREGSYTIPSSVSIIGDGAFHGCTRLTGVTIPNSVTSIGGLAFAGCTGLTSMTVPDSVTVIRARTFAGCTELTNFTIPPSITSIDWEAFIGCTALTDITIPYRVISIGSRAFYDCANLSAIYFDGDAPELDGAVFEGTKAIIYYYPGTSGWGSTFGGRPTEARKFDQVPFEHTISNGTVTITKYTGPGGEVIIPETMNGLPVTGIGDYTFEKSTNVSRIWVPKSVTSIDRHTFDYCPSLIHIAVDVLNPVYSSLEGILFNLNQSVILRCPEGKAGHYTIPDSVTRIGPNAFDGTALTTATLPDAVNSIGDAAFAHCRELTSITVGNYVTSIGRDAFHSCTALTSITIPPSVTSIGANAFSNCDSLSSVTIPKGVTSISSGLFAYCAGLTKVTIPDSVTSIGWYAFRFTALTDVTIPNSVTSIGRSAFEGCTELTCVEMPDSVRGIDWYAFVGCTRLTSVWMGSGLTFIDYEAFRDCYGLTAVYFEGDAPRLSDGVFEGTEATIYYRQETSGWGPTFGGRPTLPWSLVRGDVDGDGDVDRDDLNVIVAVRNTSALGPEDTRDLDGDGKITVLDARILVTLFSVPGGLIHAASSPEGVVLDWAESAGGVRLQSTTNLQSGTWQDVGGVQSSTNAVIGTTAERMFFRLVLPE